jgi:hypothetical protein
MRAEPRPANGDAATDRFTCDELCIGGHPNHGVSSCDRLPTQYLSTLQADIGSGVGVGDIGNHHACRQAVALLFEAQLEGDGEAVV